MTRIGMPHLLSAILWLCVASAIAAPECGKTGVNLAGAEFGKHPGGREGYDYRFPTAAQISYYARIGFTSVRLPVRWERLQPVLHGPLDERYLAGITTFLDAAAASGVDVLIDLHNYARYNRELLGTEAVPASAFFDIWQRIARALSNHRALYAYGLMNEPMRTGGLWSQVAQSGVDGIRSVDKSHRIYVMGEGFTPDNFWGKTTAEPFVRDPANLEVYEGHVYFDADHSGKYNAPDPHKDPVLLVDERLGPFVRWLAKHKKNGAVGEWGVPSDDERWFGAVDRVIELARTHCLVTYVWAGGNWSPGYKLSLEPLKGAERLLTRHFAEILKRNPR